jgi:hypothetical protein
VAVIVTKNRKLLSKNILKSGKKLVATKLYGNDAYMIHFQTYGRLKKMVAIVTKNIFF